MPFSGWQPVRRCSTLQGGLTPLYRVGRKCVLGELYWWVGRLPPLQCLMIDWLPLFSWPLTGTGSFLLCQKAFRLLQLSAWGAS